MEIGQAVKEMRDYGKRVARAGWNGRGMFLYYVAADNYKPQNPAAKSVWGKDGPVPYQAFVAMKTVDGTVVPWLCSQTDLLAQDWEVAE